jgi:hypothetical protein
MGFGEWIRREGARARNSQSRSESAFECPPPHSHQTRSMQSPAAGTPRALHQVSGLEARAGRDDDQKARDGLVYQVKGMYVAYMSPQASLAGYQKVTLGPVTVNFRRGWECASLTPAGGGRASAAVWSNWPALICGSSTTGQLLCSTKPSAMTCSKSSNTALGCATCMLYVLNHVDR